MEFTNSQLGDGERGVIPRIMTRLTIAKLLKEIGIDVRSFHPYIEPTDFYNYYSFTEKIDDILFFLDKIQAKYEWDEDEQILTFYNKELINVDFEEALSFHWSGIDYGEIEFEEITFTTDTSLSIDLSEYSGFPTIFIVEIYHLLKDVYLNENC